MKERCNGVNNILRNKIKQKKAKIAVIGLGYVGLPLAVEFAKKGFLVLGIDSDRDRVEKARRAEQYILDVTKKDLEKVIKSKNLIPTNNFTVLKDSDVVIICVPTPLKGRYLPNVSFIIAAVRQIAKYLHKNQLIVLESTTYPGTTDELILPILEKTGLICGKDFYLAFSPERIDPGNKKFPLHKITKIIGGITKESSELTRLLYEKIVIKTHIVSSSRAAEMVKLLENTFRLINISLINELAIMSNKMNINIWEVIEAAKTKPFGFMPFYPSSGVGGHCIPKDPLYLYWKAKHYNFKSKFIKLAADINSYMPSYVCQRVEEELEKRNKKIENSKILIIGVTYKKDVIDLRKSAALDIIKKLQLLKADVFYHDPLIPYLKINNIDLKSHSLDKAILNSTDCVIIVADHSDLNYKFILDNSSFIFDTCNIYKDRNKKVATL